MAAELLFWASIGVVAYVYAGFPSLVVIAGILRHRRVRTDNITPDVSLIIAVYDEEQHIRRRLENALALDYPQNALEIIVASDGSTDETGRIVSEFIGRRVKLLRLPRRGKIHALNAAVEHATGEVLVFSDATTIYDARALRMLVRNFADPDVGGVCGRAEFFVGPNSESTARSENLYFKYENFVKCMESRSGSIVSAAGCIHAIRRSLYRPIPASVTDDFAISTAAIERGKRLVFEPDAIAYEEPASASSGEFRRKVRMMTRGFRSLIFRKRLLNPFRFGFYSLVLFSHKLLRRLVPIFLVSLFAASLALANSGAAYALALAGQIVFYTLALAGLALTRSPAGRLKLFAIPFYYCIGNAAAMVALCKVLSGARIEMWQPQRGQSMARTAYRRPAK